MEKHEEGALNAESQKYQYLDDVLEDQKPIVMRSEPVIKTYFTQHEMASVEEKTLPHINVASTTNLPHSVFGNDSKRLGTQKQSIHDQATPNTKLSHKPVVVSLRDVFGDSPTDQKLRNRSKPRPEIRLFEEAHEKFDEPIKDEAKYPVVRAMSLKKMASIEMLPQYNPSLEAIPADENAVSIEYADNGNGPFDKLFVKSNVNANNSPSKNYQRLSSGRMNIRIDTATGESQPINAKSLQTPKNKTGDAQRLNDPNVHILHFPDGTLYEGEIAHNLPHGKGVETSANGDVYVGAFSRGMKSGFGKLNLVNGNKYRGNFESNKFNGMGTLLFATGDSYIGEFKGGVINGIGTYNHANGKVSKGFWRNGELVTKHES